MVPIGNHHKGIVMLRLIGSVTGLAVLLVACGGGGGGSNASGQTITANSPVDVTSGQAPPAGVHGTPYSFPFSATGGNLPISWTVTAGTLPPGLTLGPDGTLSGTPTTASPTPFAFTVTASDSSSPTPATSSAAYAIAISEPPPPSIYSTPPPTATVGSPYSFQFTSADGLAPLVWTAPSAPMGGLAVSLDGVLSGVPSTAGIFPITLTVKDALNQSSPATPFIVRVAMARPAAVFTQTGSMTAARYGHTATLLLDGRVLVAGGGDETSNWTSAELYDPTSQTFTATGGMTVARSTHTATLLANSTLPNYGKVLVAGAGYSTAELFDPAAGTFTATGSMIEPRTGQTATLLQNGRVLMAGGLAGTGSALGSAELYDPVSGTFMATGSMTAARTGHTATLLPDGRVLIAGGDGSGVASAELYDPVSGTFTATGNMSKARFGHTATLLLDDIVLVTGADNSAELFNPATGAFSMAGGLLTPGSATTATLRTDGTVLIAGGRILTYSRSGRHYVPSENSTAGAELFATESEGFTATGSLHTPRDGHTATRLLDGTVLVTGGVTYSYNCSYDGCGGQILVLSSAEVFK